MHIVESFCDVICGDVISGIISCSGDGSADTAWFSGEVVFGLSVRDLTFLSSNSKLFLLGRRCWSGPLLEGGSPVEGPGPRSLSAMTVCKEAEI